MDTEVKALKRIYHTLSIALAAVMLTAELVLTHGGVI